MASIARKFISVSEEFQQIKLLDMAVKYLANFLKQSPQHGCSCSVGHEVFVPYSHYTFTEPHLQLDESSPHIYNLLHQDPS